MGRALQRARSTGGVHAREIPPERVVIRGQEEHGEREEQCHATRLDADDEQRACVQQSYDRGTLRNRREHVCIAELRERARNVAMDTPKGVVDEDGADEHAADGLRGMGSLAEGVILGDHRPYRLRRKQRYAFAI